MKKVLSILILAVLVVTVKAQKRHEYISIGEFGNVEVNHIKETDLRSEDESYYVKILFRNQDFSYIVDMETIVFSFPSKVREYESFLMVMNEAYINMGQKKKMKWFGEDEEWNLEMTLSHKVSKH